MEPLRIAARHIKILTSQRCQHMTARQLRLLRDAAGAFHLGATLGLTAAPSDRSIVPVCDTWNAIRHKVAVTTRFGGKPAALSGK